VEAVVEHAKLERFALAGYSEGGPIAIEFAARHTGKISHLILMGTAASFSENDDLRSQLAALVTLVRTRWGSAAKMMSDMFLGEDASAEAQQMFASYQRQSADAEDAARILEEITRTYDVEDLARTISTPTLVIHARSDNAVPLERGQALAALINGAAFKSVDGQHIPSRKQGVQIEDAIREFVLGPEPAAAEPERQARAPAAPVTILFTDIESSTSLTQRLGDAKAQELIRAHNGIVRGALLSHEGSEIKHTGDGIMASFASSSSALECAAAIQREVATRPDEQLAVHIGVNAGEPVAEDNDLFGTSVQLAKRICDQANGAEVLVSDVVRQLVAGKEFLFADRGETALRGFEDPVRLYELRWQDA
jgi:class 3 adenylate cyclase